MRIFVIAALATLMAGCGQTTGSLDNGPKVASAEKPASRGVSGSPARERQVAEAGRSGNCAQAARKVANAQTNAALVGGALSILGGFGGYAGQGGMIAAQAASIGSTALQAQAQADAATAMDQGC